MTEVGGGGGGWRWAGAVGGRSVATRIKIRGGSTTSLAYRQFIDVEVQGKTEPAAGTQIVVDDGGMQAETMGAAWGETPVLKACLMPGSSDARDGDHGAPVETGWRSSCRDHRCSLGRDARVESLPNARKLQYWVNYAYLRSASETEVAGCSNEEAEEITRMRSGKEEVN